MPPTDPRFLDADEDVILWDLVTRLALHEQQREAAHPGEVQAERLEGSPDAVAGMLRAKAEFMGRQDTLQKLRAAAGHRDKPPPRTIRVGGATIGREE